MASILGYIPGNLPTEMPEKWMQKQACLFKEVIYVFRGKQAICMQDGYH